MNNCITEDNSDILFADFSVDEVKEEVKPQNEQITKPEAPPKPLFQLDLFKNKQIINQVPVTNVNTQELAKQVIHSAPVEANKPTEQPARAPQAPQAQTVPSGIGN